MRPRYKAGIVGVQHMPHTAYSTCLSPVLQDSGPPCPSSALVQMHQISARMLASSVREPLYEGTAVILAAEKTMLDDVEREWREHTRKHTP